MAKIIHRVWLGPRPMPEHQKHYGTLWKDLNSDADLIDWSWHNLPTDLPCQDVMDDLRNRCTSSNSVELSTQLADIIGYYLSYIGGIYANTDIKPVAPIHEHMWNSDFATYEEKDFPLVVNAFTGGVPNSELWKFVLDGISESYFSHPPGTEMVFTTGPIYLTRRLNQWKGKLVQIYPHSTVNPILWKDVPAGRLGSDLVNLNSLPDGCVGVHDWHHKINGRTNVVS